MAIQPAASRMVHSNHSRKVFQLLNTFGIKKKTMPINAMITEDDLLSRAMLCDLLEDYFPEINIIGMAETVKDSLQLLEDHKIDLLFLDIELPDGNGFEILTGPGKKDFGLIITTAYDTDAITPPPFNLVGLIAKPVTLPALRNAMQIYLHQSQIHHTV